MKKHQLYKEGGDIDKAEMQKAESYQELKDKIDERLNRRYKASKVKWVWDVQRAFNEADVDKLANGMVKVNHHKLLRKLQQTIGWKADWLEKKYRYVRLSYHDFEAELWKITYEAIEYYESVQDIDGEFMLVETLELWWKNRMNDFIKSCLYTEKNRHWYFASSIPDNLHDTATSPLDSFILKETVTELFNDSSLTDKDKGLLTAIYDNPDGSYREWGKEIGLQHPETVKRLFINTQKKLSKYR